MHYRRLRDNPRITVLTLAEVERHHRTPGDYQVGSADRSALRDRELHAVRRLRAKPARRSAPTSSTTDWRRPRPPTCRTAWPIPARYAIDRAACPAGCKACVEACKYDAIDLDAAAASVKTYQRVRRGGGHRLGAVRCGAARATWASASAANVVTNVMLERMAAVDGPTGGQHSAALRRQGTAHRGVRAMRRLARRESPALLLGGLLLGLA